ncbi:MAG TPA: hypothetical protein VMN39_00655 [Longimicrobiaceae bacterium]|nr:hypothetical protein [Longimicrobiaceae bacterium]
MVSFALRCALLAVLIFALPGIASAQDAPDAHDHSADPNQSHEHSASQAEIGAWLNEMQQVHQQLERLQQRALADPELSVVQEELGEEIRTAMGTADPTLGQQLDRIGALEAEVAAAQQSGNEETLRTLMMEAQQIQQRFMAIQQQVLEQPPIAAKVSAFQTRLESKMVELDPTAGDLIERFRELEHMLDEAIGGA